MRGSLMVIEESQERLFNCLPVGEYLLGMQLLIVPSTFVPSFQSSIVVALLHVTHRRRKLDHKTAHVVSIEPHTLFDEHPLAFRDRGLGDSLLSFFDCPQSVHHLLVLGSEAPDGRFSFRYVFRNVTDWHRSSSSSITVLLGFDPLLTVPPAFPPPLMLGE